LLVAVRGTAAAIAFRSGGDSPRHTTQPCISGTVEKERGGPRTPSGQHVTLFPVVRRGPERSGHALVAAVNDWSNGMAVRKASDGAARTVRP